MMMPSPGDGTGRSMSGAANSAERERWNDPRMVQLLLRRDRVRAVVTPVLLDALAPAQGERILDIGCGAGDTTLRIAEGVGTDGTVVGADISRPFLELATRRATEAGLSNVTFHIVDIQTERVDGGPFAAAVSQFGVMFFDEPVVAFRNIRAQLAPSGRLCFACWRAAGENPWFLPVQLAQLLPAPPKPAAGRSRTGPFALADAGRVRALLGEAGFVGVDVAVHRTMIDVPEGAVYDEAELEFLGVPPERTAEARELVETHLARFRTDSGSSRFPLAYQIVTARA